MSLLETILVVEDEPDAVTLLEHAFTKAGITTPLRAVSDGDLALAYLQGAPPYADRRLYPRPQLVLLDLKLPRCSGLEVLARIRADPALAGLPVVILTSSRERSDVFRAYAAGANSYLVKPSSLGELITLAGVFRDYWLFHNELPPASRTPSPVESSR